MKKTNLLIIPLFTLFLTGCKPTSVTTNSGSVDTSDTTPTESTTTNTGTTVSTVKLSSIAITTNPTKLNYTVGEVFDPTGAVVTAYFSDNTKSVIEPSDLLWSPTSPLTKEDTLITVSYTFENVTKTAAVAITVNDKGPKSLKILFQGDSITDSNRSRTDLNDLGDGYAKMVSEELPSLYEDDYDFTFINRANSGWNLIADWNNRSSYQEQFYDYDADIAIFTIGYNDIMDSTYGEGDTAYEPYVSDSEFENAYKSLLNGLIAKGTYPICIAPYFINSQYDTYWNEEFTNKARIVEKLTSELDCGYINLSNAVDNALANGAYPTEIFGDLTHPIETGCSIFKDLVIDQIRQAIDKDYVSPSDVTKYEPKISNNTDDELGNNKIFSYSDLANAQYDQEVFANGSTQSIKMSNCGAFGVQSYSKVFLDLSSVNPNLSSGKLEFDVKLDNAIPWISVIGYDAIFRNYSNHTSEEGLDIVNTPDANGWYHLSLDLDAWANKNGNKSSLENAKGLVFAMSRGENEETRQRYGIDDSMPSTMWIDNIKQTNSSIENKFDFDIGTDKTYYGIKDITDLSNDKLSFDIEFTCEINSNNYAAISLGENEENFYNAVQVYSNGYIRSTTTWGWMPQGYNIIELSSGKYNITVDFSSISESEKTGSLTKINYLKIYSPTASGSITNIEKAIAKYDLSTWRINITNCPTTATLSFDVNFTCEIDGDHYSYIQLCQDESNYYKRIALYSNGILREGEAPYDYYPEGYHVTDLGNGKYHFEATLTNIPDSRIVGSPTQIQYIELYSPASTGFISNITVL